MAITAPLGEQAVETQAWVRRGAAPAAAAAAARSGGRRRRGWGAGGLARRPARRHRRADRQMSRTSSPRDRRSAADDHRRARAAQPRIVVERIARGADGPDQLGLAADVDRLAEPADVDVDGAQLDVAVAAPDRVEQPLAREDPRRMFEEMAQQPEFGRAERDRPAAALHLVADDVHFEIGEVQLLARQRRPRPAQHRPHPGDQLARARRAW